MNNIYLVTFNLDNEQFLLEAKDKYEAIYKAHEKNAELNDLNEDWYYIRNHINNYYYAELVDFKLLLELIGRKDIHYKWYDCVAFIG